MQTPARLPESTYRLQFHAGFTFADATAIVPYLHALGVTHAYASPYFAARPGSTHGYDVIDHTRLNPELGTEADYEAFVAALAGHGMSHVLDTVPNHMGVATNDNAWWNDVLEKGLNSRYRYHFDIAWRGSPRAQLQEKVLLPVLGSAYAEVLERGELRLSFEDNKIFLIYFDRRFPISIRSFQEVPGGGGSAHPMAEQVASFNGIPGDARSFDRLHTLLERQHYRLCHWRNASDEINYRRFFDINDLAALSMEREEVFEDAHVSVFKLIAEGKIAGLRIDHPDGLYDPKLYFDRLQERYVRATRGADDAAAIEGAPAQKPLYVVAEKILAQGEPLPESWACHGTSGYDFLILANGLFVDAANADTFTKLYTDLIGDDTTFPELVYQKKKLILDMSLASELRRLTDQLDRIAQSDRRTRDFTHAGLSRALKEVIACFPVYRSYVSAEGVSESDRVHVKAAVEKAIARNPKTGPAVFHFIADAVLQKGADALEEEPAEELLDFAVRFQQLTAPVTAKGVEDTAFYIYNRLISLNEVGGEPDHFGTSPADLHAYLADRQAKWPYAMSAVSTHDTKRSEDVRARINVLSEIPDDWRRCVDRWRAMNAPHRQQAGGNAVPDANEEYLLYQTLVGAWPLESPVSKERETFVKRIQAYMDKALREAKIHTSWTDADEAYDAGMKAFIAAILDEGKSREFLNDFSTFQRRISHYGLLNSLSQTLVRLAAPGVPDTYQGTELWDFSLVDPDNRRPVDYAARWAMLNTLKQKTDDAGSDRATLISNLLADRTDGRVKMFVTWLALAARRDNAGLFTEGEYLPATITGPRAANVFAFAQRQGEKTAIVAVPRLLTGFVGEGELPLGERAWQDTTVEFEGLPAGHFRNVFTGEVVGADARGGRATVKASELFARFPVALLLAEPGR